MVFHLAFELSPCRRVSATYIGNIVEVPHGSLYIAYKYTGAQNLNEDEAGNIYTDTFGFRLLDSGGEADAAIGAEANYTLHVRVGISACATKCDSNKAASAQQVTEDVAGSVTLYCKDYSDSPGGLRLCVLQNFY